MPIPKTYNKDFFKTWSSDMAYILGFMYADGNITETKRGNYYIAIYTADKDILLKMAQCIQSKHKIAERVSDTGSVFRIQIGSKEWFKDLAALGLHPNKTTRMLLPSVPLEYAGDFIRGYFDGDGNVWKGLVHKNRPVPLMTLQVAFTSCSVDFLHSLLLMLKRLSVTGGSVYTAKTRQFSRLAFSARDALIIYEIMYNNRHKLCLKRKKVVFEQFMKLRA